MSERPLDRLSRSCGIEPEYRDIRGRVRRASDATKVALLEAMGLRVAGERAVREVLAEREARRAQQVLAPVSVVRAGAAPGRVAVTAPASSVERRWAWSIEREHGGELAGEFRPADLQTLEAGEAGGRHLVRVALELPRLPQGYHRLELLGPAVSAATRLVVAPHTCYVPDTAGPGRRVWGPAVQLYAVRSARNWGAGDFTDLTALIDLCAVSGAGIVGLNPLHALFPTNPAHASPYSPSSRVFLNTLYLDLEAVADFAECDEARRAAGAAPLRARLAELRRAELVDYEQLAAVRRPVLEMLYAHFRRRHLERDTERARAFREFQARGGAALAAYGTFAALDEHFHARDPRANGWPAWPAPYREPHTPAVREFAEAHAQRVELHQYVQWQTELQLAAAGRHAREVGLAVGPCLDLAVGIDGAGFDAWADRELYALGARIGAPPDDFSLKGQDWGLPPPVPERLAERAYAPFIDCLRAGMRHAGALRVDHVMGLLRLYWVPAGRSATEGAYVRYPFGDLLGVLALESDRHRCLVIGEDLGTVPDEVRAAMRPAGLLSTRLFYFTKTPDGEFAPPAAYPEQALVGVGTHDLPTLAGWWRGRDLALRSELALFPDEAVRERLVAERARDRERLLRALHRAGLLPPGTDLDPASVLEMTAELAAAVQLYLARGPSRVMTVQPEDVLGVGEQINLPATTTEHPNWRRKLPLDLDALPADPRWVGLAARLRAERGDGNVGRESG